MIKSRVLALEVTVGLEKKCLQDQRKRAVMCVQRQQL